MVNRAEKSVEFTKGIFSIWLKSDLFLLYRIEDLITLHFWSYSSELCMNFVFAYILEPGAPSLYPYPWESGGAWVAQFLVRAPGALIGAVHFPIFSIIFGGCMGVLWAPLRRRSA